MKETKWRWAVLVGLGAVWLLGGCSDDDSRSRRRGAAAGAGGAGGATAASGGGQGGAGGAGGDGGAGGIDSPCLAGIDTACEECGFEACPDEALACAELSTCDEVSGEPSAGCLALVNCAAANCTAGDVACVPSKCGPELSSAGGLTGEGTQAALALGNCVNTHCVDACMSR